MWIETLPQPWTTAMEAIMFTAWVYDHLLPHGRRREARTSPVTIACAQNLFASSLRNSVLLARERIHGPANAHAYQQKKK
jgi:hypothetical protein